MQDFDDDILADFDNDDTEDEEEDIEIPVRQASEALAQARKNKSDSYQYRIVEIAIDPFVMSDFASEDGFGAQANLSKHSDEMADLRQQLAKEVKRLIKTCLTTRQAQVMVLRLQGRTQMEIGQRLGISQPTVHNTINGSISYENEEARYGGAIKKLRKACFGDERVLEILKQMTAIRVEEGE